MSRRDPQGLGYDPAVLQTLVDVYGRMLRELNVMRRGSQDVEELRAIAAVTDECVSKQASAQRRLDRIECQRRAEVRRVKRFGNCGTLRGIEA